jgi:hypothetical protein
MDPESLLDTGVRRHSEETDGRRRSAETGEHRRSVESIKTEPLTSTEQVATPVPRWRNRNRLVVRL